MRRGISSARSRTGRWIIAVAVAAVGFTLAAPAGAQVRELLQRIAENNQKFVEWEKDLKSLLELNEYDKREYDRNTMRRKELMDQIEVLRAAHRAEIERRIRAANANIDDYNAACGEQFVGKLREAAYSRCIARLQELNAMREAALRDLDRQQSEFTDQVIQIRTVIQSHEREMDKAAERMKQRFANVLGIQDQVAKTRAELEPIRDQLVRACLSATNGLGAPNAPESLYRCELAGWNSTSRQLPPLNQIKASIGANAD